MEAAAAGEELEGDQWATQTEGWGATLATLRRACSELGPFDGVLGFSQGAAVAAALAAMCLALG